MHVEVDEFNESNKENQQHRSKKKLQRSEISEVGFMLLLVYFLGQKRWFEGFLGNNVVVVEYTQKSRRVALNASMASYSEVWK